MLLALQLLLLFIGVGGAIVAALTLPDSRAKWGWIAAFGIAGAAGFVLTVITYERTPDVPHLSDLIGPIERGLTIGWLYFLSFLENRWVEIAAAAIACVVLGKIVPHEYRKRFGRKWLSSYKIFNLADQNLMKDVVDAEAETQAVAEKIIALREERERYGVPFGSSAIPDGESDAIAALQATVRDAAIQNTVLHERREKARRRALEDIYHKLRSGRLIAKGYVSPANSRSKEKEIPAGQWKLIQFKGDYTIRQ